MTQRFWKHRDRTLAPGRRTTGIKGRAARTTLAAALLLAAALGGCAKDGAEPLAPTPGGGRTAELTLTVPGMKAPSTRAMTSANEQEVAEVDVVIFENTGNTLVEYHHIPSAELTPGGSADEWRFKISEIDNDDDVTFAVVANASPEVADALAALAAAGGGSYLGSGKADFLEALQVSAAAKWNASAAGYWRIPMYGELPVTGSVYAGTQPPVNLTRMLAKVDVVNAAAAFTLTAVHVVNRNTAGFAAPAWDANGDPQSTTAPNLPSNPGTLPWADGNELTYTVSGASLTGEIYLFEAEALSTLAPNAAAPGNGLRLVLEGTYNGANYFYPVDFTADDGTTDYIPVLRNHSYTFTVSEASGRGYDRLGEAAAAWGVSSNLKISLLVVNEGGIRNIAWNGQYFLGLEDRTATLEGSANSTANVKASTNYAAGWEIDASKDNGTTIVSGIEYAAGDPVWLSAAPETPGDPKAALVLTTLSVNQGGADRTATVHLKAGRLTHSIAVTQKEALPLYVGRLGGKLLKNTTTGEWQFERELYVQPGNHGGQNATHQWYSDDTTLSGSSDKETGKDNTYALATASSNYAAAYACYSKNGPLTGSTDPNYVWYLPAQTQLMAVWGAHPSFDAAYKFTTDNLYWSATENSASSAYYVNFSNGETRHDYGHYKSSVQYVRCVMEK